jgi:hypothetical protein
MGVGESPRKALASPEFDQFDPYRSLGIIHGEPGEPFRICSPELPVNNSGDAIITITNPFCAAKLPAGFAARPGRRMVDPKRSTFTRRASPLDGGFCPMTNTQNFSPASCSDEFYKGFAGRSQVGNSTKP